MKTTLSRLIGLLVVTSIALFFSCNNKVNVEKHLQELKQKGTAINNDFKKIRLEVENLSHQIEVLYKQQQEILPLVDTKKYQLAANGVFYKPTDDGGSAVFVSGYYPVNETIKRVVYFTEPIDTAFKSLVKKYPEIVQVYYNDKYSLNRIYPFFDVLSQYEAKMNIPGFNFYYLADLKHNPGKKSLWVNEPYVDPAGRGWMVSAIAPVYVDDSLAGVPGIDVTINSITQRYIKDSTESMHLIIDHTGVIVAAEEETINLLSFPPLYDHKYIETIKQDTYRKDQYNVSLSKDVNVRNMATEILVNKKEQTEVVLNNEKFITIATHIPELNWYILEIIK
jgi:uncharacterized protein YsxB (DUF464 family)